MEFQRIIIACLTFNDRHMLKTCREGEREKGLNVSEREGEKKKKKD
jgi:hypothetical protein